MSFCALLSLQISLQINLFFLSSVRSFILFFSYINVVIWLLKDMKVFITLKRSNNSLDVNLLLLENMRFDLLKPAHTIKQIHVQIVFTLILTLKLFQD